ncbi:hypothetical protein [Rhodoferax aquaticus]|uniref:Type IV pilus assembly protein PilM n=1 Tax=Rhodoferax aquaticus TaxID=2527691 RepID=A0A515EUV9_9BURK|nr:hypothetical protein [Rhodoferax aquaticus]QDL56460.1 hypothetical protein EXZ61_21140 [Rhodoferax aquaticus]
MSLRWPWSRSSSTDQLVVSWASGALAFVRVRPRKGGGFDLVAAGIAHQGEHGLDGLVDQLEAHDLRGLNAAVMLRPEQYQFLQIDAPAVAPEELRAAARYLIRDMVPTHLDDITLDVLRVGDGQQTGTRHLFVVATTNAVIQELMQLAQRMQWPVQVIDVQETAQRNLQSLGASGQATQSMASAALVLTPEHQAILTISANEELFYTRRFDLPDGFLSHAWGEVVDSEVSAIDAFTPVEEYVPDYAAPSPSVDLGVAPSPLTADDGLQRLVVEVQRSLDLWERTWSSKPLSGLRLYAGERSAELADKVGQQLGQTVGVLALGAMFAGWSDLAPATQAACMPLLGVCLRTEPRKL